jgi:nicotinate-nucleotide pyrophosphorylase (carboxylating)
MHEQLQLLIEQALAEDGAHNDLTAIGCVPPQARAQANLVLKETGCIAGLPFVEPIFKALDPQANIDLRAEEGKEYSAGSVLASISGSARALLSAERTALNLLQHLSGIATLTARCVALVRGTRCKILDTRKTLPGYRQLQKYAVRVAGGTNHRMHLSDRILIKNNHIAVARAESSSPVSTCVARARARFPAEWIEVEVATEEELVEALSAGADAVLLDNMSVEEVRRCVEWNNRRAFLEASGGIHLGNLRAYAETGVDAVSIGALTHSAPALDMALRLGNIQ